MKLLAKRIITNPVVGGSFVMVIGMNAYNASQFLYHSLAGRFLGKALYGDLAAIISLLGLISIIQFSLGLTIVKFVASEKDKRVLANLIKWINLWSIIGGFILGFFVLAFSPIIIGFLKIQQPVALFILAPTVLITIIITAQRSILQGVLGFKRYVLSLLSEAIVKIIVLVVFIVWGLTAFGGMVALFCGVVAGFLVTRFTLVKYLKGKREARPNVIPLVRYSVPVLVQGLALTSMYSTDLMLVKHFFAAEQAGLYASLVMLGRVVFFGSSPITSVMFPMIVKRHAHGQSYHTILYISFFAVAMISLALVTIYTFLPKIPILILYGNGYLEGAPILWIFGLFMALLGLAVLFVQFYLSVGKTHVVWLFATAAVLQATLIWFIHTSLVTVISISSFCAALLLLALLVYFPYHGRK